MDRLPDEQPRGEEAYAHDGLVAAPLLWAIAQRALAAVRERKSPATPAVVWGLSGFVFGAVFWHFIGFWGFVSDVVFSSRAHVDERLIAQTGPYCVEVALDRTTGAIWGKPCALEVR